MKMGFSFAGYSHGSSFCDCRHAGISRLVFVAGVLLRSLVFRGLRSKIDVASRVSRRAPLRCGFRTASLHADCASSHVDDILVRQVRRGHNTAVTQLYRSVSTQAW